MRVPEFRLDSAFSPAADQPKAIDAIAAGVAAGDALHDAAGRHRHRQDDDDGRRRSSGSSARRSSWPTTRRWPRSCATSSGRSSRTTRSSTSSRTTTTTSPRPTSPSKDLYIEKDSAINQEVDRLRHAATAALFARRDVIIVASVSAIFGLGSPETYDMNMQVLKRGEVVDRDAAAAQARRDPVLAQRHRAGARAPSASAARRSRSSPPTPRPPSARRSSATRSSACSTSTR